MILHIWSSIIQSSVLLMICSILILRVLVTRINYCYNTCVMKYNNNFAEEEGRYLETPSVI